MKPTLLTAAGADVDRQPAQCEPLWRYQDLAPALQAAPLDSDDEDLPERSTRRWLLRCQLLAPRSAR